MNAVASPRTTPLQPRPGLRAGRGASHPPMCAAVLAVILTAGVAVLSALHVDVTDDPCDGRRIVTEEVDPRTSSNPLNEEVYAKPAFASGVADICELRPVGPIVYRGPILHPFAAAEGALRFYSDFSAQAPDELTMFFGFLHALDGSGNKLVGIVAGYDGPQADAERALAPLKAFGSPVVDAIGPIPPVARPGYERVERRDRTRGGAACRWRVRGRRWTAGPCPTDAAALGLRSRIRLREYASRRRARLRRSRTSADRSG